MELKKEKAKLIEMIEWCLSWLKDSDFVIQSICLTHNIQNYDCVQSLLTSSGITFNGTVRSVSASSMPS